MRKESSKRPPMSFQFWDPVSCILVVICMGMWPSWRDRLFVSGCLQIIALRLESDLRSCSWQQNWCCCVPSSPQSNVSSTPSTYTITNPASSFPVPSLGNYYAVGPGDVECWAAAYLTRQLIWAGLAAHLDRRAADKTKLTASNNAEGEVSTDEPPASWELSLLFTW